MSVAHRLYVEPAGPAERFASRSLPRFERALREAVAPLATGLGPIDDAVHQAVGLGGVGGRRWRPLVTLAGAEAAGVAGAAAMRAAVGVELTHTASLVLDDLPCMDDSAVRRGRAATHRQVGTAGAILLAVGLLGRAAELMGTSADAWGRTIGLQGMAGGQAVDVACSGAARGAARRLMRRKTTVLAALAAGAGAAAGGAPVEAVRALEGFGTDLGWAYQLADDALDAGEDGAAGRIAAGRWPRRQAAWLLRRARRRLRDCAALSPAGVEVLDDIARDLVPMGWAV
ncbi:MAG: polyprenyl synthetase family protein [Gemmatimonadales bacterium]|nr:polyprenyl synthetase family protein [Gemmatimonadales bacterium]